MREERSAAGAATAPKIAPVPRVSQLADRAPRGEHDAALATLPTKVRRPQPERESLERLAARRHRRVIAGFLAVAVALVAVLTAGTWWWVGRLDGGSSAQLRSVANESRTPAAPVPLPADGEHTVVRVHDSGDLEVEQWVRRPTGITHLALAMPEGVQVTDLSMSRGSRQVGVPSDLAKPTEVSLLPGTTLYLHYWLSGALERSGSRALARATSLNLIDDAPAGVQTIDFVGATVLSLACMPTS
jgi:hypothetical protein